MAIKIQGTTVIDDSRNATNLGDITASGDVNFTGSGSFKVPSGTTAQRPASPSVGEIRYNTDNSEFEQYDGSAWVSLAPPIEKGSLDKTFANGESASISLSEPISGAPIVSVIKEVPQTGVTSNDWDVASDGANYALHDTAYDTSLTPEIIGYILEDSSYTGDSISLSSEASSDGQTIAFKPDGTKMYVGARNVDRIFEYDLSTPWNILSASYDNASFDISSESPNMRKVFFKPDGTKMYVGSDGNNAVVEYDLNTAWDITSASYSGNDFDVSSQGSFYITPTFKDDGSKMFVSFRSNDDIHEYSLSNPWDISSASYSNKSFTPGSSTTVGGFSSHFFKPDGTYLYVLDRGQEKIHEYELLTPWDISNVTYSGVSFDVSNETSSASQDIIFRPNGTQMFYFQEDSSEVFSYNVGFNGFFSLGSGSFASDDVGKRIIGNGGEAILTATDGSYEEQTAFNDNSTIAAGDWSMFALDVESGDAGLTLSGTETIATAFDIENASYDSVSFTFSESSLNTQVYGVIFNNDGTRMYMTSPSSERVYQYDLQSPFDISTAGSNDGILDVTPDPAPIQVKFNNTGSRMFVMGRANNSVYQYNLSSDFDITTANYSSISFSTSGQDGSSQALEFNNDGTKMYMAGQDTDSIYQYSLSTAFDVSTASYDNVSFDVSGQDSKPSSLKFNNNGTKLFMTAVDSVGSVFQYSLSTPFDLATASYDNVSLDVESEGEYPRGVTFNTDGTKMFVSENDNGGVYQYTTGTLNNFIPTSANHTAITSASTDTEFWTDINSMTADDEANDGAVYYAVSTDDRTTWKIIDDTDGVRDIVRDNDGTWEVNDASDYGSETWVAATQNDEFYALEEAMSSDIATVNQVNGADDVNEWSYTGNSLSVSSQENTAEDVFLKPDGTKLYMTGKSSDNVYQYTLSTPWDISTASYDNVSFSVSEQDSCHSVFFKDDGSVMFIGGKIPNAVHSYTLSTPWDVSTASYDNKQIDVSSQDTSLQEIFIGNDGSTLFTVGRGNNAVNQYDLSTPWDVSSGSYSGTEIVISQASTPKGLTFSNDGLSFYVLDEGSDIFEYSLSSAWDLSTASYTNKSKDIGSENTSWTGLFIGDSDSRVYAITDNNIIYQYDSGQGTVTSSTNRMDATQLNAVSDANHYTLGDGLDLAITMTMPDGNTSSPTSDGVSINYDANVLNQGAVLGTDYEFDAPAGDTVRIKALSGENFKVKVI